MTVYSDRKAVGQRIRSARQSKELTGQQLARLAGISAGYLSEVERGLSAISGEKLVQIADALGMRVSYLLEAPERAPAEDAPNTIQIPAALSEAAEQLGLSYIATRRLLEGRRSLVARRSQGPEHDWTLQDWCEFYNKVKRYIDD